MKKLFLIAAILPMLFGCAGTLDFIEYVLSDTVVYKGTVRSVVHGSENGQVCFEDGTCYEVESTLCVMPGMSVKIVETEDGYKVD